MNREIENSLKWDDLIVTSITYLTLWTLPQTASFFQPPIHCAGSKNCCCDHSCPSVTIDWNRTNVQMHSLNYTSQLCRITGLITAIRHTHVTHQSITELIYKYKLVNIQTRCSWMECILFLSEMADIPHVSEANGQLKIGRISQTPKETFIRCSVK